MMPYMESNTDANADVQIAVKAIGMI